MACAYDHAIGAPGPCGAAAAAAWSPRGGRGGGLAFGLAVQAVTVAVVVPAAYAILARRDPAA